MADLSITPGDVVQTTGGKSNGVAGEAITAGQTIYKGTGGKYFLAQADTEEHADAAGVALNNASVNQPISYQKSGVIVIGATVVAATFYVVSETAGAIFPLVDVSSGNQITLLGIGVSETEIALGIIASGIEVPA